MEMGTIEVTAAHSALAFIYALFRPNIEIDGKLEKRPWGTHAFEVTAGPHKVEVSYPWLFSPKCGRSSVEVNVAVGEIVRVRYKAPPVRYVPGMITVDDPIPSARVVR
jgi:hypothetical protein